MSLWAVNASEHGVRGVHAPSRLEVKRLTPDYDAARPRGRSEFDEDLVVVIVQDEDGLVTLHVAADVAIETQRLASIGRTTP